MVSVCFLYIYIISKNIKKKKKRLCWGNRCHIFNSNIKPTSCFICLYNSESGYEFDKTSLMEYNHMSFGGPPVTVETVEEADELLRKDEKDSTIGKQLRDLRIYIISSS